MRWILAISATVLIGFAAPAADPLSRTDLDKRMSKLVFETVTSGVELYNAGNYEGCYRLYQGTLSAIVPLLDHKPKLAESVANQLAKAKKETATDGAFTLRTALDEIQNDIRGIKKTLWDRLGGQKSVEAVVHDFVGAAATNKKVNFFRDGKFKLDATGVARLEKLLVELISANSGGPLKYTGRDMKSSHAGMQITEDEFNALAGDLVDTLKKYKVPQTEIDELVAIVASTKKDMVETKKPEPTKPEPKKVLWDRLGGQKSVEAVVHDFVAVAATNKKVNFFRDGKFKLDAAGVTKLEKLLVELISANSGGPLKYTGRDMKTAHAGMKITEDEFNALAGDLVDTLKKYKVPQTEIDELVAIVASTKKDMVEVKKDDK